MSAWFRRRISSREFSAIKASTSLGAELQMESESSFTRALAALVWLQFSWHKRREPKFSLQQGARVNGRCLRPLAFNT